MFPNEEFLDSVSPDTTKSLKMFIHEPGAEIWLLHANLLLKGQAAVFTLPKYVIEMLHESKTFLCVNFFTRSGFTDLALEKVVTSGFSRPEQKVDWYIIFQ